MRFPITRVIRFKLAPHYFNIATRPLLQNGQVRVAVILLTCVISGPMCIPIYQVASLKCIFAQYLN